MQGEAAAAGVGVEGENVEGRAGASIMGSFDNSSTTFSDSNSTTDDKHGNFIGGNKKIGKSKISKKGIFRIIRKNIRKDRRAN